MKQIFFLFLILLFLEGCINFEFLDLDRKDKNKVVVYFHECQQKYFAKVADTDEKRAIGFSNVTEIEEDQAILFVFENEKILSFWMKDTYVPLDILFLDENKKIVDFFSMEPCLQQVCPIYSSAKKAKYAIEVKKNTLKCPKINSQVIFDLRE